MKAEFYLKDEEQDKFNPETKKAEKVLVKDVLFFKLVKPAVRGAGDVPYEFDGYATEEHKKHYKIQYQAHLDSLKPKVLVSKGIGKRSDIE